MVFLANPGAIVNDVYIYTVFIFIFRTFDMDLILVTIECF